MPHVIRKNYGRLLDDFVVGQVYRHPWEVTIDDGMRALFSASFLDASAVYSSREFARTLGFEDRPIHPVVLLNLGLSFSVHDVSEQAIAHLAYLDVRFPEAAYRQDTVRAYSKVLDVKPSKHGERGIVHVCTWLKTHADVVVCAFERKALIRSGRLGERSEDVGRSILLPELNELERLPSALRKGMGVLPAGGFSGYFEDFEPGQVLAHGNGRTISDSEPMQLSMLLRNSHPLHFDEVYCAENSFTGHRIVYGGLVLGWVFSLMSRDVAGNALWEMGIDEGAHPHPTHAGDTLFAACRVESKKDVSPHAGMVTFRVIGLKNHHPEEFLKKEADIFEPERTKVKGRELTSKILEVSRTLLIRKRP